MRLHALPVANAAAFAATAQAADPGAALTSPPTIQAEKKVITS